MDYVDNALGWASRGFGLAAESVRNRHLIPKSLLIGVVAGALGVAFRVVPDHIVEVMTEFRSKLDLSPVAAIAVIALVAAALSGFSVWVVLRFAPEAGGGGIPHLRACLARRVEFRWVRLLFVKVISLFTGVAGGLGLGAEAPAIHAGAACGQGLARILRAPRGLGEHRALISAGAAAGLSAAFNAPLAGVIFVLEELQGDFSTPVLVCAVLASASADVLSRHWIGHPPVFHVHGMVCPTGVIPLIGAAVLGLLAGLIGALFNRWVVACARLGAGRFAKSRIGLGAIGGALTTICAIVYPGLTGGGASLVESSLTGGLGLSLILTLISLRFASTLFATASGASGGFMVPLLALGALTGCALGGEWNRYWPESALPTGIFVAVGMGAFFSASVRAPLTGLVLVLELTGDYGFMLPALIACMIAFLIAEELGSAPVYHSLGESPGAGSHASTTGSHDAPAGHSAGSTESNSPESSSQSMT